MNLSIGDFEELLEQESSKHDSSTLGKSAKRRQRALVDLWWKVKEQHRSLRRRSLYTSDFRFGVRWNWNEVDIPDEEKIQKIAIALLEVKNELSLLDSCAETLKEKKRFLEGEQRIIEEKKNEAAEREGEFRIDVIKQLLERRRRKEIDIATLYKFREVEGRWVADTLNFQLFIEKKEDDSYRRKNKFGVEYGIRGHPENFLKNKIRNYTGAWTIDDPYWHRYDGDDEQYVDRFFKTEEERDRYYESRYKFLREKAQEFAKKETEEIREINKLQLGAPDPLMDLNDLLLADCSWGDEK